MITYSAGCVRSPIKQMVFPGGEVLVQLPQPVDHAERIYVNASLRGSDDVMALLLTVDAIRRQNPYADLILHLPYVPYARQDRVCNEGESLSIAVMAQLINSCNFDKVRILDPHSDVTPALIKNVHITEQSSVFANVHPCWDDIYIVAPDAGAYKKSYKFAQYVNAAGVITCNKVREMATGKILGLTCSDDVVNKKLFVLDDICDGGRTFIEVSALLREKAASIELGVTHGIFSKGQQVVAECFDKVYTTNSFHGEDMVAEVDNIKIIRI
ncbi:Ribose-phosphate pyrophosphokinase 2 [compost metagenome]